MPYDIILGRDAEDQKKFGKRGTLYLGKGYVTMGTYTSLSNKLYLDVARSHVILVAGKRGSGKSYSLGVIAEELANLEPEVAPNIGSLIFDTMGIFWTMKFKNEKDRLLLKKWDLDAKTLPVQVLVPEGKVDIYKKNMVSFDTTFSFNPSELAIEDWLSVFKLTNTSQEGVALINALSTLKEKGNEYTLDDISHAIAIGTSTEVKNVLESLIQSAHEWGIFSTNGTTISSLVKGGQTTVLDLSTYSATSSFNVRALVIGLISRKLFEHRMDARKSEEVKAIQRGEYHTNFTLNRETPLVWLFIDEAHEFLPRDQQTPATESLVQILREGRQPGISLVLATQQPGKIHTDVMTQSDIVISHRVTSEQDMNALNQIMQTYLLETIKQKMDELPSEKGSAIILDDNAERMYPMRIRPRFTWHGGESPQALKADVKV